MSIFLKTETSKGWTVWHWRKYSNSIWSSNGIPSRLKSSGFWNNF